MVDVLQSGTLDEAQQEAAQALRAAILALDSGIAPGGENDSSGEPVV